MLEAAMTIGSQMLDLQHFFCEQVAASCTKKGGTDTVFVAVNPSERVMTVTRTVAPVSGFTGAALFAIVGGPTEYIGGDYEARDWNKHNREYCAVSKALFYGKKQLKHMSHAIDRAYIHIVSHHMNRAERADIKTNGVLPMMDYGMVGHLCAATINPTRNESVSVSVARWLSQIMAGISGDASAIAKKADTGVFMTQLSAYTILQTLVRCGAVALLRDAQDFHRDRGKELKPIARDGMRTVNMTPTFATAGAVNLQQMHNNWYTCEVFTGTHGNLTNATLESVDLVFDIIAKYEEPATKRRLAGVGDFALRIWKERSLLPKEVRMRDIAVIAKEDEKFWISEADFMLKVISNPADKGTNSVLGIVETGLRHQVPAEAWHKAMKDAAHTSVASVLTDKKGLLRHDEFRRREGATDLAAKAFLPGLLPELARLGPEELKDELRKPGSARSASVLACGLRALGDGRTGTATIVNKADSVEKSRCIAIMDWILRYPSLLIETALESVMKGKNSEKDTLKTTRTVPQSVLEIKDKVKPMMQAMDQLRRDIQDATARGKNEEHEVRYTRRKLGSVLRLMNDASSWGPWKNLPSMITYVMATGAPEEFTVWMHATMELFIDKDMVLHSSLQPPLDEYRKPKGDMRREATIARTTTKNRYRWETRFRTFV